MSKNIALLALPLFLFVGVFGYATLNKKSVEQLKTAEDMAILLYVEDGDVSYKTPESQAFLKATSSPVEITNGTLVYTGIGHASILFPNNSNVSLDKYTELTVRYSENKVSLLQTLGTTYHRVEALVTGGSYEVETPGTLAAVRGTKFAVKYDNKQKVTKVAVTEHEVAVSKLEPISREVLVTMLVEEGKLASTWDFPSTGEIIVSDTSHDSDMKAWVDVNKEKDTLEDSLKSEGKSKEEVRSEIIKSFSDEPEDVPTPAEKKEEARPQEAKSTSDVTTETKAETSGGSTSGTTRTDSQITVKKIDYVTFFDTFNTKFFDYFYLDDKDTPCTSRLSAGEKVKEVTVYATASGYPFTSATLMDFAQDIDGYCKNKDAAIKAKLQARFDGEFPFQENI